MNKPVAIEAAAAFTPFRKISPARIVVEGEMIAAIGSPDELRVPDGAQVLDASGLIVTPGFIDPHIHGAGGAGVMDGSEESLNTISRILARHGTTSFLPTTVSSPPGQLTHVLGKLAGLLHKRYDGARPLGIHLEGPFINSAKRGTHRASNVLMPDAALLNQWLQASGDQIRLLTIAPELEGADSLIDMAQKAGVIVAMGHSDATLEQASAAADLGVCYAVHTFNAMRQFAHRDPGIAGAVLSDDRIFAEIIADGIHVDPSVIRVFARAKTPSRVLLVTDAIAATGMPGGTHMLGTDKIDVADGVCRNAEGRLAGSTLTQDVALKNFMAWTGLRFEDALLGLTLNPAKALKLQRKGVLEPGADADLAMFDSSFCIVRTLVGGKLVYG